MTLYQWFSINYTLESLGKPLKPQMPEPIQNEGKHNSGRQRVARLGIFQTLLVNPYLKAGLKIAVLYNPVHTPGIYYLPQGLINHFSVHLIKGAKIWYSPNHSVYVYTLEFSDKLFFFFWQLNELNNISNLFKNYETQFIFGQLFSDCFLGIFNY